MSTINAGLPFVLNQEKTNIPEKMAEIAELIDRYGLGKIIIISGRGYLTLWETLARAHLLLGNPEEALAILAEKLEPWFAEYDFKSLLPRYYALQSEYYRFIGDTQRAAEFQAMREERLKQGRAMIADKFLAPEIMDYLDNIVDQLNEPELTTLYQEVRERLATGFIPPDEHTAPRQCADTANPR